MGRLAKSKAYGKKAAGMNKGGTPTPASGLFGKKGVNPKLPAKSAAVKPFLKKPVKHG